MQLFYNPELSADSQLFSFDKEESRHIVKVLRKKEGDILYVTNGKGDLFETEISIASDNKCTVKINASEHSKPSEKKLHIAIAPTKMNERLEWFLEKATEIGIEEITPVFCERSERKQVKLDRMEKILVSAMKQSGQYHLPKLNEAVTFKQFIGQKSEEVKAIAHCLPDDKKEIRDIIKNGESLRILIGPEGDFTEKEIALALAENFIPVSLGNTRLRTETAGIYAATAFRLA